VFLGQNLENPVLYLGIDFDQVHSLGT
jgi:hypothetical protein